MKNVRDHMKDAALAVAAKSRISDIYAGLKALTGPRIAILESHIIGPERKGSFLENSFTPEDYERFIEELARSYEIISLDGLANTLRESKALPDKGIVITLDDGYKDNYRFAYPIFKKHHIPATMFVATGHIGTQALFWSNILRYVLLNTSLIDVDLGQLGQFHLRSTDERLKTRTIISEKLKRFPEEQKNASIEEIRDALKVHIPADIGKEVILSWDEVREMSADGIVFGAHTVNHPILTGISLSEARWEIVQSKKDIEEKTGKRVNSFGYPNGGYRDFNHKIISLVKDAGFQCAVTTIPRWVNRNSSIYQLGRIEASKDINQFKLLFSGLYGDMRLYRLMQ